jgi:uncharacterized protein (DUF58 family)
MDIKEIERVVASVQHAVFRNANSIAAGAMRSRFKGAGLQFRDHQIYTHGDDVRFIDWKVSARSTHIYLKTFEEDRNVEICVFIDISPSCFYGSSGVTKIQMAFEVCALLYLLAQETHDLVRVVLIQNGNKYELPNKKGREGLILFISWLEKMKLLLPGGKVNLQKQFEVKENDSNIIVHELKKQLARKKEVVYLGDMANVARSAEFHRLSQDVRFHGMRLLSPLDVEPLKYSFSIDLGKAAGLSRPKEIESNLRRFPLISSDERYLEQFLRRLK